MSQLFMRSSPCQLHSLESCGVVEGEVGKHFAVDLDTCFVDKSHQLRVGEVLLTGGSVDTLNPESAEVALLLSLRSR